MLRGVSSSAITGTFPNGIVTTTIAASGNLTVAGLTGLGGTTNSSNIVTVGSANPLTGVTQIGINSSITGTSAATTQIVGMQASAATAAAVYTSGIVNSLRIVAPSAGAGSTITRALSIRVSTPTSGTNNAAIADTTGFTGNWFINQAGTAANALGGVLVVGTDPGGSNQLRVGGSLTISSTSLLSTKTSFTDGAAAATGTLTNAPAAGNPTKWIPLDDNGTTRYFPAW